MTALCRLCELEDSLEGGEGVEQRQGKVLFRVVDPSEE
jgi:hypothetical protein